MTGELQRFPVLRKRMDEVVRKFLGEGLGPSETMIGHIIEMEGNSSSVEIELACHCLDTALVDASVHEYDIEAPNELWPCLDYINTSHPNFIGGSKAIELATHQVKSARLTVSLPKTKDVVDSDKQQSEKSLKSRAIFSRSSANGIVAEQGVRPVADVDKPGSAGNNSVSSWGIPLIFSSSYSSENRAPAKETSVSRLHSEPVPSMERTISMIQLKEQPPTILRLSETHTFEEEVEIAVTKVLLRSYYDIVRKNIEDSVPKAIMHFLVNHTKRELHNVFIGELYRDDCFEEMLQEPEEIATKRKRARETLKVLNQAFRTLDELPLEAETVDKSYSIGSNDPSGAPYTSSTDYNPFYQASAKKSSTRSRRAHSGELQSPFPSTVDANGGGNHRGQIRASAQKCN
ncbi:hypothetical protein ACLOJK_036200 [Asimina triloba]